MNLLNRVALGKVARCIRAITQAHGFGSPSPEDCYAAADSPDPSRHVCWMVVEACVSLSVAWTARSPARLAFGSCIASTDVADMIVARKDWRERRDSNRAQLVPVKHVIQ